MEFLTIFILSVVGGISVGWFLYRYQRQTTIKVAEDEATEIIAEVKSQADLLMEEARERAVETEETIRNQHQKELGALQARVDEKTEEFRLRRSQGDREYNQDHRDIQKQISALAQSEKEMAEKQRQFDELKKRIEKIRGELVLRLVQVASVPAEEIKAQWAVDLEQQAHVEARRKANLIEDEARAHSETIAKRVLGIALSRFPRASSTERGIGTVPVESAEAKAKLLGKDGENMRALEVACGVDLSINENNVVQISGYDPVRRELTTRCLERVLAEKNVTPQVVERIAEKAKKDLTGKIENDGRKIASELGMNDLNPEIKNMLGSLRYRYSFAQNQFFHVAEVGWLCSLLALELGGVDSRAARRSGLLHDIGKAMDHSIEGGHAVIGADFIQRHGEKPHIVHAVRAHHYEEQPHTDLAFLVIAADAISGARPGARRSTVNVYNQKMEVLQNIGDGFAGVTKTLVFNAGREVRILVDGAKVNDVQSLQLCRQIADKIEDECSFPGQIKVVVVRETHAEAFAK